MFSSIDLFGKPVELNFNGKDKSRSFAGAWFSLIFIGFILWSIYMLGKDLIYHQEPKTITSDSYVENPLPMVLSPNTFNFGFGLQHPKTLLHYINESIYTVEVTREQLRRVVKENGSLGMEWTYTPLLLEICTKEHFGALASNFENIELNQLYCLRRSQPELDKIQIQGVYESPLFEHISIMIKQCDNRTSKVPCAAKETLDELLGGGWFKTYFTNLAIDSKNYDHPNLGYRDSFYTSMSNSYFKHLILWLSHVEVTTDSGWATEELGKDHFIKADNFQEYTSFRQNSNEMINFVIRVGKITKTYDRSYIKAQDLIAKINGLVAIGIIIGYIFFIPYSRIKFYERLTNELFDVKNVKNKENEFSKKRTLGFPSIIVDGDKIEENEDDKEEAAPPNHQVKKPGINSDSFSGPPESIWRLKKFPTRSATTVRKTNHSHKKSNPVTLAQDKYQRTQRTLRSWANVDDDVKFIRINTFDNEKDEIIQGTKDIKPLNPKYELLSPEPRHLSPLLQDKPKITKQPQVKFPQSFEIHTPAGNTDVALDIGPEKLKPFQSQDDPDFGKESNQVSIHNNLETLKNLENRSRTIQSRKRVEIVIDEKEIAKRAEKLPAQLTKDSYHINITFWEYIRSYFWKTKYLKQKFGLLEEGIRRIEERLNIFNLLKKLREVDKLKLLLLENEQFILFDSLPNPELSLNTNKKKNDAKRSSFLKLKETIFVAEKRKFDLIKNSYIDLKKKNKQTMIDDKLLEIYDEIIDF